MWNSFSQMGESARDGAQWSPNALPLWESHSWRCCECSESCLEKQTSTKLGSHDTIRKALKRKCLKCSCIVHLDLICMSYDQKKGWESNWEFDFRPQTFWKQGSNEFWLGRDIHRWKIFLRAIKYYFQIL